MASELTLSHPVEYYLHEQELHGKSVRTLEAYERVLRDFEAFVSSLDGTDEPPTPANVGRQECMAWVHDLRGRLRPSTIATYASYVHRFYDYMTTVGELEANPMALVVDEMPETIEKDPTRRELGVSEMRSFVGDIRHPLERTVVVTLLKTGMRVGELCNLDLRDVHLSARSISSDYLVEPRGQLQGRPNSLYVDSEPSYGHVFNGERRTASNKRKRATVVPIDDELSLELERYLAIRPDSPSPAEPLFCSTGDRWGGRLRPSEVRYFVENHARARGWYQTGGGAAENVTPHYFRHFFTTHLRDRTGERGIVKYLRGDVASDIIDTYTHNWGDRVREVYEANIYSICP